MVLKYTNKTNIIGRIRLSMFCVRELSGKPSYILVEVSIYIPLVWSQ